MDGVKLKRRKFVSVENRPSPDLVNRQMAATAIAFRALGSADAAREYLNDFDEPLNGRPLDIAGASSDGLRRVSEALTSRRDAAALNPS